MNADECARCLRAIAAHRPDMKQFAEPEVEVEGGWVLLPRGASGPLGVAPPPAAAVVSSA